jgi:hypothetical protein
VRGYTLKLCSSKRYNRPSQSWVAAMNSSSAGRSALIACKNFAVSASLAWWSHQVSAALKIRFGHAHVGKAPIFLRISSSCLPGTTPAYSCTLTSGTFVSQVQTAAQRSLSLVFG